ncbi:MAG: Fpg/Nei family DNA glycosylase [Phycisphaerales bacterium]
MPELPDIEVYIAALRSRVADRVLSRVLIRGPFVLRTFDPPVDAAEGKRVLSVERLGKRIVLGLEGELFLVIHLMIAGRLLWKKAGAQARGKIDLASFDFHDAGVLVLTEASPKKRASLHVLKGRGALAEHDRGGIDVLSCSPTEFGKVLIAENRTLKRRLTDSRAFSGIGNAYSDEILHAAQLSPVKLTTSLKADEIAKLHESTVRVLTEWIARLHAEFANRFPGVGEITAFRPEFAVHGRYGKPCPVCSSPVQRIVHAENETNYCATCQTGGKVLADRSLSRLLKDDWPRTIEEWESDVGETK